MRKHKNNLIVSYKSLTDDLREQLKIAYPDGYNDRIQRFLKPNGETMFYIELETDDAIYRVKIDRKIDTMCEDLDKALFDDDSGDVDGKEEEFAPLSEAIEKEEMDNSHRERHLRHGDFEDVLDGEKKKKITLGINKEELKQAFGDDDDDAEELDSYDSIDDDDEERSDDDYEPSDDDLRGIEDEFIDAEIPPLGATIPDGESERARKAAAPNKKTKAVTEKHAKAVKTMNVSKPVKEAKPMKVGKAVKADKPVEDTKPAKTRTAKSTSTKSVAMVVSKKMTKAGSGEGKDNDNKSF